MADYTQDANCIQAFILDDGTANTNDRSTGGRNLTVANGTWGASNNGYIFDADATGTFTPAMTTWQAHAWTIAILTTVPGIAGNPILVLSQSDDVDHFARMWSNPFDTDSRVEIKLQRDFADGKVVYTATGTSAKNWYFIEYAYTGSNIYPHIYRGTTDVSSDPRNEIEFGSMTLDTGNLGSTSSATIYQVGFFTRTLTAGEKSDIVANGLKSAVAAPSRRRVVPFYF